MNTPDKQPILRVDDSPKPQSFHHLDIELRNRIQSITYLEDGEKPEETAAWHAYNGMERGFMAPDLSKGGARFCDGKRSMPRMTS